MTEKAPVADSNGDQKELNREAPAKLTSIKTGSGLAVILAGANKHRIGLDPI
jgi:hypothetical protein